MTPTVVLRGDCDLKTETIPTSWIAEDALLRSEEFSIKECTCLHTLGLVSVVGIIVAGENLLK